MSYMAVGSIRGSLKSARTKLKNFRKDESGAAFVFALIVFVLMLVMGGLAVDVARMEAQRMKLKQTVDRAVLAAANLENTTSPEEVVTDYFEKTGMIDFLVDTDVQTAFNSKKVTVETRTEIATAFLHLVGVNSLAAEAGGSAIETISDIEISLVIDISGSMTWDNHDGTESKLETLQDAANDFIDDMIGSQTPAEGITMMSIIPHNATVNAGEELLGYLNPTDWHEESHCIRFYDDDFLTRAITPTQQLERVAHFARGFGSMAAPTNENVHCKDDEDHAIIAFETDAEKLKTHIDNLEGGGMTAVDAGMKWAAALIDPAMRPVVNSMITDQARSNIVTDWPREYGTDNVMKVIVLMTDGENTTQRDLRGRLKSTDGSNAAIAGDIFWSPSWGSSDRWDGWLVNFLDNDSDERWYRPGEANNLDDDEWYATADIPGDLLAVSYQDLFKEFYTYDMADYFYLYADPDAYEYWNGNRYVWSYNTPAIYYDYWIPTEEQDNGGSADDRLEDICDAVKDEDVIIFSIAFEAPTAGETVMRYCAENDNYYYEVDGSGLDAAFKSIAGAIDQLRLIQ